MSDSIKVRLLVVDDEQSIRKLCMTIGNSLGYACSEAESVETAVARIEQEAPDLIRAERRPERGVHPASRASVPQLTMKPSERCRKLSTSESMRSG